MSAVTTLLTAETRMLSRNILAWSSAVLLPLLMAWAASTGSLPVDQGPAVSVIAIVMIMLAFTLHSVGTMTLAARRKERVLVRWRSSASSDLAILFGTVAPVTILTLVQSCALIAFVGWLSGTSPVQPAVLAAGLLGGIALVGALTFVAAAFTKGPDHAMITAVPLTFVLFGAGLWTTTLPAGQLPIWSLAIPGTQIGHLLRIGWEGAGTGLADLAAAAGPSLLATVVLTAAATVIAVRRFRWTPRT